MLNRKIPPEIREISGLQLPQPQDLAFRTMAFPIYVLDYPGQAIVKLELAYRVGRPEEHARLVSRATARMIREGSRSRTGGEIAEQIDFYGASFNSPTNLDSTHFLLFSLKKHFQNVLPIFAEAILEPTFPIAELDTFKRTSLQELQVDLEKPEVLAYRKVTELIFGEAHPYGYNSTPADYDRLTRRRSATSLRRLVCARELQHFHQRWRWTINCSRCSMIFLEKIKKKAKRRTIKPSNKARNPKKIALHQPNSLQTAIKMGRRLFNKKHPDYNGFFVLNTVLGGYFGSRLMANIREKKGFTYNIYSTADAMLHDGCFYISTEVHPDAAAATRREILREMKKLPRSAHPTRRHSTW